MSNRTNIRDIFDAFEGKNILIIGDVMVDAYIWGQVDRISPEAPVPVVAVQKRESRLGGAANVALNIRNLGGVAYLCGMTGADEKGSLFEELLKAEGLPAPGLVKSASRPTTVKFRIFGNNAQMLRVDEESIAPLDHAEQTLLLEKIKQLIDTGTIDAIVFEDYDKGVVTPGLIEAVSAMAKEQQIPIAVDPKKNNFLSYAKVDLFKPNLKELREGLKLDNDLSDPDDLRAASKAIHDRLGVRQVMVTLSDKGVLLSVRQDQGDIRDVIIPAHLRSIADVSGAGDTVIGTAAMCMAVGADGMLMAALCNLAGGLVCEQVGVVPVDKDRLLREALVLLREYER